MKERIVFTRPEDGGVSVVVPSGEIPVEQVMQKFVPSDAINPRICTVDDLPKDRLFRNAWDDSNPEPFVGTNLNKAKEIAHQKRRDNRQQKMEPLDREQGFASTGDARKAEILSEKRAILDTNAVIQDTINNALDEDELRVVLKGAGITD